MQAEVGDRIIIKGHHVGDPDRDCEVLEVHGKEARSGISSTTDRSSVGERLGLGGDGVR
jgi:hypothetical protein